MSHQVTGVFRRHYAKAPKEQDRWVLQLYGRAEDIVPGETALIKTKDGREVHRVIGPIISRDGMMTTFAEMGASYERLNGTWRSMLFVALEQGQSQGDPLAQLLLEVCLNNQDLRADPELSPFFKTKVKRRG